MYLLAIIISTICMFGTIMFTLHKIENASNLYNLIMYVIAGLLMTIAISFMFTVSYKAFIFENENCTTHNHPISEQVSNKDCYAAKGLPAKDKDEIKNNTNMQANCEGSICNQCGAIIKHESNPVDNPSKEQHPKEAEHP